MGREITLSTPMDKPEQGPDLSFPSICQQLCTAFSPAALCTALHCTALFIDQNP